MKYCVYETYKIDEPNKNYVGKSYVRRIIEDKYLGSGKYLGRAIKRYGRKMFDIRILKEFDTEEAAYQYEEELEPHRNGYYNITIGGRGGLRVPGVENAFYGKRHTSATKKLVSDKMSLDKHHNWSGVSTEKMIEKTIEYGAMKIAAEALGVSSSTIAKRIKNGGYEFVYSGSKLNGKVIDIVRVK